MGMVYHERDLRTGRSAKHVYSQGLQYQSDAGCQSQCAMTIVHNVSRNVWVMPTVIRGSCTTSFDLCMFTLSLTITILFVFFVALIP